MASKRPKPKNPLAVRGGPQSDFGDRLRAPAGASGISKNSTSKRAAQRRRTKANAQARSLEPSGYLNEASNQLRIGEGPLQYKFREDYVKSDSVQNDAANDEIRPESGSGSPQDANRNENEDSEDFISFDFDDDDDSDDNAPQSELALRFAKYEAEEREKELKSALELDSRISHFTRSTPPPQVIEQLPIWPSPWLDPKHIESYTAGFAEHLNQELIDFAKFVSPLAEEVKKRHDLVDRVKYQVRLLWRNAELKVFGSFPMGLYLPGADVDLVVVSPEQSIGNKRSDMFRLGDRIRRNGWAEKVDVLSRARVPIIKFTDSSTQLDVDISFEQMTGPQAVETVNLWMAEEPALQPLTLLVKQFLRRRKLNDPAVGGLGGYATVCLVRSMLKTHQQLRMGAIDPLENLGLLLLDFFELYGRQFNYQLHAVNLFGDMEPLMKRGNINMKTAQIDGLAIQDPNDPNNNVARATHNFGAIRREFAHAADLLKRLCSDYMALDPEERKKTSLLAPLLKCTPEDVKQLTTRRNQPAEPIRKPPSNAAPRPPPVRSDEWPPRHPGQHIPEMPFHRRPPPPSRPQPSRPQPPKRHPLHETFEEGSTSESEIEQPRKRPGQAGVSKSRKVKTMRPNLRNRRGSDSEDSRTKASDNSKREYWKSKGIEPREESDSLSRPANGRNSNGETSNGASPKPQPTPKVANGDTKPNGNPNGRTNGKTNENAKGTANGNPGGQPKTQTKAPQKVQPKSPQTQPNSSTPQPKASKLVDPLEGLSKPQRKRRRKQMRKAEENREVQS